MLWLGKTGLVTLLPGFQFSGVWAFTCRFPWLQTFLLCLPPYLFWRYQSSAMLCFCCLVVMLMHSCISLHHMDLCPLVDLFVLYFLSLLYLAETGKQQSLWQHRREETAGIYISCVALVCIFLSRIFWRGVSLHIMLTHTCSGLIGISTRTFGCYSYVLDRCFGIAAHVVGVHTHCGLNFWTATSSQQLRLASEPAGKIPEVLRICVNIIS